MYLEDSFEIDREGAPLEVPGLSKNRNDTITEITRKQANQILDFMSIVDGRHLSHSGFPFLNDSGKYYFKADDRYTAMDFSCDYEGFLETFDTVEECMGWLNNAFEMDTHQHWLKDNGVFSDSKKESLAVQIETAACSRDLNNTSLEKNLEPER